MQGQIKKGMILSAGLGTRLLPITKKLPKPLVPVVNIPNILYCVSLLKNSGIKDIVINLHHLPDAISNFLGDGSRWGVKIAYSREDILLGTGGGVKRAERFFEGQPFVLLNCDFITNAKLEPIIEEHFSRNALATMALIQDPLLQSFYSKVGINGDGNLCSLPSLEVQFPSQTGIFTGIHVLDSEVLSLLEEKPCGINEVMYPKLMKQDPRRVFGTFLPNCYWCDTGDSYFLWMTSMRLLELLEEDGQEFGNFLKEYGDYEQKGDRIWMPRSEKVPENCELEGPVIIGKRCKIGNHSKLGPYAIIGDASIIDVDVHIYRFVALPGSQVRQEESAQGGVQFENSILPIKKLG